MKHLFSIIFKSPSVRRLLLASSLLASIALVGKLTLAQTIETNVFPKSGNVGIGTIAPNSLLEIGNGFLHLKHSSNNGTAGLKLGSRGVSSGFITVDDNLYLSLASNSGLNPGVLALQSGGGTGDNIKFLFNTNGNSYLNGGNVGIGTPNPGRTLEVAGNVGIKVNADTGGNAQITFAQGGTDKAYLTYWNTWGTLALTSGVGEDGIHFNPTTKNVGIGTPNPGAYRLKVSGNSYFDGSVESSGNLAAKYQDVAEWVEASEPMEAGTVVVIDSDQDNYVAASRKSYDTTVAGVVSAQPGLILGEAGPGKVKVAANGRVKVKVTAKNDAIHRGDLLVTSDISGTAMRSDGVHFGAILGKALQNLESGEGEILVLLTLQ